MSFSSDLFDEELYEEDGDDHEFDIDDEIQASRSSKRRKTAKKQNR